MIGTKSFLASRTVWANAVGLLALLASLLGYPLSDGDTAALTDAALELVAAASLIASTLFRVVATRRIGG